MFLHPNKSSSSLSLSLSVSLSLSLSPPSLCFSLRLWVCLSLLPLVPPLCISTSTFSLSLSVSVAVYVPLSLSLSVSLYLYSSPPPPHLSLSERQQRTGRHHRILQKAVSSAVVGEHIPQLQMQTACPQRVNFSLLRSWVPYQHSQFSCLRLQESSCRRKVDFHSCNSMYGSGESAFSQTALQLQLSFGSSGHQPRYRNA